MRVEPSLCEKIIKLDRNIRFAGIVNKRGEVIEGGFKHGVEPLLNGTNEQQMYIHSLSNLTTLESYSDWLGFLRYSLTEYEKVKLFTFPLDDGILCLSATSKANTGKIRDKVMKVLKVKYRGKTRDSTSNGTNKKKPPRKRVKDKR